MTRRAHADQRLGLGPPEMRVRFAQQNLEPRDIGPAALAGVMQEELARWSEVIRTLGVSAD